MVVAEGTEGLMDGVEHEIDNLPLSHEVRLARARALPVGLSVCPSAESLALAASVTLSLSLPLQLLAFYKDRLSAVEEERASMIARLSFSFLC